MIANRVGRYYNILSKSSQQALAMQLLLVINLCDITVCAILIALSDIPYVYCKWFTVKKFCGFRGLINSRETFPVKKPVQYS